MSEIPENDIDNHYSTFVVDLNEQHYLPSPTGGELLIIFFGNDICRIAWRQHSWDSWGPPIEGEKR